MRFQNGQSRRFSWGVVRMGVMFCCLLFLWFCLWLDDLTLQPLVGHAGCVHATVQCLCVVTDTVR